MLCEAMRYYPGNKGYKNRIEFSTLCKFYFGQKFYIFSQIVLNLSLQAANVAAIIETAQVMDLAILRVFSKTGGLEFYPHPGWVWAYTPGDSTTPFGDIYVLSLGYVVTLILIIPMGLFNLDDNMIVQKGAFVIMIAIFIEWFTDFGLKISSGAANSIPFMGEDQSQVLGTIIFNYAFVVTVPSWCNEKVHSTSIHTVLWTSTTCSTVIFVLLGVLGAMAYTIPPGGDILDAINSSPQANIISQIAVYLFPISVVATSIPIMSIIIRYNLLENKLAGKAMANFWGVVFPWIIVIPFYTGSGLLEVITWSSIFFQSVVNFILPFLIYIKARKLKMYMPEEERQDLDEQLEVEEEYDEYCFGKIRIKQGPPAAPHFAFPQYFDGYGSMFLSAILAVILGIVCLGVVVLMIMSSLNVN
eukprot:TRINITY_DN3897_c0_g1_i1.p1 TRINITY_DN3897_c0_g1~~TRINITY_DN3897_c0_g1_i1.p1  ORF type:complete len:415 (+),score=65.00 TRINITY_DN3897_c0_g1_i1:257-1501(+)